MELHSIFQSLLSVALVSLAVLAVGTIIMKALRQPLERVRCIQLTLAALLIAVIVRQGYMLPEWPLYVLPSEAQTAVVDLTERLEAGVRLAAGDSEPGELFAADSIATDSGSGSADAVVPSSQNAKTTLGSKAPLPRSPSFWKAIQFATITAFSIGAAWSLIVLCIGRWRLSHIIRTSHEADESLLLPWKDWPMAKAHGIRVYVSETIGVPMAFGVRKPVILIPSDLANSDRQTIDYCLSHEWAHIKSRDVVTWWAMHLMQPLLWFQPLFWFLRRELRTAQDQLADNFALKGQTDRSDYAQLLMSLAQRRGMKTGGLGLTMADRRSGLFRRVELLLANKLQVADSARRHVTLGTIGCLSLLAIGTGMLRLQPTIAETPATLVEPLARAGTVVNAKNTKPKKDDEKAVELSFSGKVIDEETESPIEGATVLVRRSIHKSYDRRLIEETSHLTDANGEYHFTVPPEQSAESSLYIELDVVHPDYAWWKGIGYSLSMIRKNLKFGAPPFFSKILLSPASPVTGRVLNPNGNPVPNTRMLAYCEKGRMDESRDHGSFMRTSTDKDGKFELQMAKEGASVFWVVPDNFSPVQIISGSKRGDWGDITVSPGVRSTGKVVSSTGEPIAGVWVNLEDHESQKEIKIPVASSMIRSAKTAADGTFSLGPMRAGKYSLGVGNYSQELTLKRNRYLKRIKVDDVFVSQNISLAANDANQTFTIQAKPHVEFHAQYLNSKGEPRSGHQVMIYGQFDGTWFHTSLPPDKDGKIFGKLPRGLTETTMDAITNEHSAIQLRLKEDGPLVPRSEVSLGTLEEDISGIEIIRYKAPIVQIKPVDENGNVVKEGVKVSGIYTDDNTDTVSPVGGLPTNVYFENQDDGRHRSFQMLPDREAQFSAKAKGYESASTKLQLPEGESKEITLVLKKATPKVDKVD